jgi:hypothetical protein
MTTMDGTRTRLGRRTVLALAVSVMALAGAAQAQRAGDLVGLTVVDRDTGQPLRVWRRDGRLFVAGQPGARYSLRVTNNSGGRVLVVMSVDGVNILTGETAGYNQRGYVISPYESHDISGWRKSDTEIAAFNFAPLAKSYAARTGRPGEVGVIGIAAFTERVVAPAPEPTQPQRYAPSADVDELVVTGQRVPSPAPPPAAMARRAPSDELAAVDRRTEKLGTAHGAREWSVVTTVAFTRATPYPQLVRRIEYDSFANLVAIGVIPPSWDRDRRPRPFPSSGGYVPDPPGGA